MNKRPSRLRTLLSPRVMAGVVAAAAVLLAPVSQAATATSNLSVTAEVAANCTISTAAVAFGSYDPVFAHATTPLEGTGTITVTCTQGATTAITLDQGANADAGSTDDAPLRRLANGGSFLSYSLYADSGRVTPWGNTAGTGVEHVGTGTATELTVYGSIGAGQNVPAGSYADTVVATVTF